MQRLKTLLSSCILILAGASLAHAEVAHTSNQQVTVSGAVTDFEKRPISGAEVIVKDTHFQNVVVGSTDVRGIYNLAVEKGRYLALYVCKDYSIKNLEFWAWNLALNEDMTIDARIDGLEVYAINAFLIQREPSSLQIYFRPMSLKRLKKGGGKEKMKTLPLMDIAPRLKEDDVSINVNGESVRVLGLNRVAEWASDGQKIRAYLVQAALPVQKQNSTWKICLTLRDTETNEHGEGCLFWEKPI